MYNLNISLLYLETCRLPKFLVFWILFVPLINRFVDEFQIL